MSYDAYASFADSVKTNIAELDYEQQLGILTIVINAMSDKKREVAPLSRQESLALFNRFKGSMKVAAGFDAKAEKLAYLDERYSR